MGILGYTILTLCVLGVLCALILYFVAQKFKVYEDPRIDDVEKMLPGANCGGCGYAGCRTFASTAVGVDDMSGLFCPVGGAETMKRIADFLGKAAPEREPMVAVLRCNGSQANRPRNSVYDGASSCAVEAALYAGETGCAFGCLGKGDCVTVCNALHMDPETGLPVVDQEKCTACGACVKKCPKMLFELRKKGPHDRRVYVACMNRDKGGVARKSCTAACIGCGKCVKACPFDAITLVNNLAYIDFNKCRLIDAQTIFMKMERRNLAAAYKFYCGRKMEEDFEAHRADQDTEATYRVLMGELDKYAPGVQDEPERVLNNNMDELADFSKQKDNVDFAGRIVWEEVKDAQGNVVNDENGNPLKHEVFNFGKYKGWDVAEILTKDPGYFTWVLGSDFTNNTKQVLTRIRLREFNKRMGK